ncbi:MAG: FCD domain-containing protein [Thermomicrobiales bacterium]|nr:FCD domain-containing protein [Thermomicrobiales bacterium]
MSNQLANGVVELIRQRELGPGDRLPTARELAETFEVATPTMREALRRLQATGVIDIRHGSGIYVRRTEQRLVVPNPGYGELETFTILQILDARLLVEPHLAELAARNIDSIALAKIERVVQQAANEVRIRDYLESNVRFHTLIARASGNLVLAQFIESLIELYSVELDQVDPNLKLVDGRSADNAVHQEIYTALTSGNGRAARDAMARHLQTARQSVSSRLVPDS